VLAPLGRDGALGDARAVLEHAAKDGSLPELAATRTGFAALTLARACRDAAECATAPVLPTFVELDSTLAPSATEPLRLAVLSGEAPDLAWGLGCAGATCRVLAAQATSPTPVWAVRARRTSSGFVSPVKPRRAKSPPRVAELSVVARGEPLADVALTQLGDTPLAAWVTYFDPSAPWQKLAKPAPDGRLEPTRALLQVRALPGAGALPAAETISLRARSLGGVSIAAGANAEALLVWTAIDFKLPQVFVTVVDQKGKKQRQRMLTRAPGEKSDVAVVAQGDGWLVSWIDERSGDPELYAARVNRFLQSAGPEKRLTQAKGGASGPALLALGADALVAWSDSRDEASAGAADIFVAKLKGVDASLSGTEQLVERTPAHGRSPVLSPLGSGAALAWIEETLSSSGQATSASVRMVALDAEGKAMGKPSAVSFGAGSPTAVALDCADSRCRVLIAAGAGGAPVLWVSDFAAGKATSAVRLMSLTSPTPLTVAPALRGREAIVADRAGNDGRVRRALFDWK
jgi:hypothetical protein